MVSLAEQIAACHPEAETLAIYWLCQAGFVFKDGAGRIVCIDPYFSDVVEKRFGFARLMQCPIRPEELNADLLICTHEHLDHMDVDALPVIARNPRTHFAGPIECYKTFEELGISASRRHLLGEGESVNIAGVAIYPVFADHGISAPDALGIVLNLSGARVYHTGDTAYRPREFQAAIALRPDILIPCINGRFGNLDATEAALLTRDAGPELCIPSHFGMFEVHNGDPALFLKECQRLAPGTPTVVMQPGDPILFRRSSVERALP